MQYEQDGVRHMCSMAFVRRCGSDEVCAARHSVWRWYSSQLVSRATCVAQAIVLLGGVVFGIDALRVGGPRRYLAMAG